MRALRQHQYWLCMTPSRRVLTRPMSSIILQRQPDGKRQPVAYAFRSMSITEQHYAQIEKETLATTWSCERFSYFLLGKTSRIETDHKHLVSLFGPKKLDQLPPMIQRYRMRLMRFNYTIAHVAGKDLFTADTLSRSPRVVAQTTTRHTLRAGMSSICQCSFEDTSHYREASTRIEAGRLRWTTPPANASRLTANKDDPTGRD